MNKVCFLFLGLILIACSPQVIATPEVTVTLPTETPIPTPTLHPEFIALQNLINDSSERFTLLPDGTLEEVTVDGGRQTVPNLHVDQNGIINIIFNNEHVLIEQSQIIFDDEVGITIEGYTLTPDGNWVEAYTPRLAEVPVCATMYDVLTPSNHLNPDHMADAADLQARANWIQTQLINDMFTPDKIKPLSEVGLETPFLFGGKILVPNHETAPNYRDSATAPFLKDNPWCGSTMIDGKPHIVVHVPYYVPGRDASEYPVLTGVIDLVEGKRGTWRRAVELYVDRMNLVPWYLNEESIKLSMQYPDPQTGENFTRARILEIFGQMEKGDFSHSHGLVLYFLVATSQIQAFE